MLLSEPKTCCPGHILEDPKGDYAASRRAGQYKISRHAFYVPSFPGTQYIPFSAVTQATLRNGCLSLTGCCGKELPVIKLHLDYAGGSQDFVIDPSSHGDTVAEILRTAEPAVSFTDKRA